MYSLNRKKEGRINHQRASFEDSSLSPNAPRDYSPNVNLI